MTTFRSIEAAIHELSEARENNKRALERLDMCREADANTYAIEG